VEGKGGRRRMVGPLSRGGKGWSIERVREGKVGRDCAVLKIPFKKPWSWTVANFETDRRSWDLP